MKNEENTNFLDARTLLAVVLVGLTFVGWQTYMQKKYPDTYGSKPAEVVAKVPTSAPSVLPTEAIKTQDSAKAPEGSVATGAPTQEKLTHYKSDTLEFDISSRGMGVKGFQILRYKSRDGKTVEIGHPEERVLPLETRLLGRPEALDFQVEMINPNLFVGHAQLGNLKVTKTMEIQPEKYLFDLKVVASGQDDRFIGLSTALTDEVEPEVSKNIMMPQFQKQEFYVQTSETKDRVVFAKENLDKNWTGVKLASVGSQYFTQVLLDNSAIIPEAKGHLNRQNQLAELILQYPVLNRAQDFEISYKAFIGPKSHELLHGIDENLARVVDFGFFNWIGRHILDLLKAFYAMVGNWGVAVICLTLLVRLMVLPLNIYSYKSMRVMQTLQPQIQALRERFKDDQAKQQSEMMALMKQNKANPLAGCLPVFLQFPIFIALYQVLGNSIELYQAPLGLWIHDLSLKDPFYILPVLLGVTMFVQQKITPNTTMDPAQAKVLLFMPVVFSFFMASSPSGLTLYMLVGAVFSVAQQSYFLRQSKTIPGGTK